MRDAAPVPARRRVVHLDGPGLRQAALRAEQEEVDASLRYQIMEVVDRIRWIPGFGYERELDWLLNMHDWMISKKRYWGLALPIYDCQACGTFDVVGGREELRERAVDGWDAFEGHTPHRPHVDAVTIACPSCGAPVERIADVGNPWLDAGIVPFSTLHFREDPDYWANWFPADFITESFPGQFRNWFYSMLAMSTVLRREPPFKTIFGYALVFGEDGRPMHKSWGNAIEFDEAAERMGVDVMRWMFARARPEENILFGWHAADEARRELLVLWNVYAFFVTYARLAGWTPGAAGPRAAAAPPSGRRWIAGSGRGRPASAATSATRLADDDALGATRARSRRSSTTSRPGTCACRGSGSRGTTTRRTATRRSRRSTRALLALTPVRRADPAVPDRVDVRQPGRGRRAEAPDSRPPDALAGRRARGRPRRGARAARWRRPGRRSSWPGPSAARPASGPASRSPGCGSRCPAATCRSATRCSP